METRNPADRERARREPRAGRSARTLRPRRWLRRRASALASRLWSRRVDPQQRLLVGSFVGLAAVFVLMGVAVASVLAHRMVVRSEVMAGTLMAGAVRGHLLRETVPGVRSAVAPPPSDVAWWTSFRSELMPMIGARDVDVLDAHGVLALGDQADESETRPFPARLWRKVRLGQPVEVLRRSAAVPSGTALLVAVPVAFVDARGVSSETGAVAVEVDAMPILRASREARDLALVTTAVVLVVLLGVMWLLIRRLTLRSYRDPLTELPNRRFFAEAGAAVLGHNERHARSSALLYADIDRFGEVNASLGQLAGDAVLRSVAGALSRRSRAGDVLARVGGDDFALLLNEADAEQARRVAEDIATTLETATAMEGQRLRIGLSIGIAMFPHDGASVDALLQRADRAMRAAKGDHVPFAMYRDDADGASSERLGMEADLRDALLADRLDVHFQPVVVAADGRRVAYEALARWTRNGKPVSPGQFVPVAENTGLIRELDRATYRGAVEALAQVQRHDSSVRMSANLSVSSLADPTLPAFLRDIAERHGVAPKHMTLEVTESTAMQDLARVTSTLEGLRNLGFHIALDDFGTGYSSLAYLRTLPIDIVKIDRQFVMGIGREGSDETLIKAIIDYAASLGIGTVAEGVETPEQHRWLREQGIVFEQGYLHGRPTALANLAAPVRRVERAERADPEPSRPPLPPLG